MKVKWLGHASFLITAANGTRIITDPYTTGGNLKYGEIAEAADIVTVSHEHSDHNNTAAVQGNPEVVKVTTEVKGIKFKGIPTYHDTAGGKERGSNLIFCFTVDGVKVCHLGDLGHALTVEQVEEIGNVDVLLLPVGGVSTINASVAAEVVRQLEPSVVVPMHYKTPALNWDLDPVDKFLKEIGAKQVEPKPKLSVTKSNLPDNTQVFLLDY